MTSRIWLWRRLPAGAFVIGSLIALTSPAGFSVPPAHAQDAPASAPSPAFAEFFQLPNGCYLTVKNKTTGTLQYQYPGNSCVIEELTMWEQWFCCPIGRGTCTVTPKSTYKITYKENC